MDYGDTKTSQDRLGNYKTFYLKIARGIVFIGFAFMFLISMVTIWEYKVLAETNAHITLKSIIYQNIRHK